MDQTNASEPTKLKTKASSSAYTDAMVSETISYFRTHAFSFLIWGWALFAASVLHYAVLQLEEGSLPFDPSAIWPAIIILAALVSVLKTVKKQGQSAAMTYSVASLAGIWRGFSGPVIIALMMGSVGGWALSFPFLIAAFGWGIISTGVLIRFKPLIYGGISTFLFAVLAMYVATDIQLLMITGAVSTGYLLPGYLLLYKK